MLCDLVDCDPMLQVLPSCPHGESRLQREWSDISAIFDSATFARGLRRQWRQRTDVCAYLAQSIDGAYDDLVPTMKQVVDAKDIVYGSFGSRSSIGALTMKKITFGRVLGVRDIYFFKFNLKLKERDPEHEQRKLKVFHGQREFDLKRQWSFWMALTSRKMSWDKKSWPLAIFVLVSFLEYSMHPWMQQASLLPSATAKCKSPRKWDSCLA